MSYLEFRKGQSKSRREGKQRRVAGKYRSDKVSRDRARKEK